MAIENQTHDYLQDFLQTKSSLQAGKAEQNLNKRVNFELHDGSFRIMTNAEFIQYSLEKQLRIAASPEKKPIDEDKADRINRAFANGNYYIIVLNLGSLYKETAEMKNLEQVMKTPWLHENSAEHFRAEKAAINSIIEANTPTKMYYHVQMNDKGASMPISKTMYDYGMFIQQQLVDELYPKVMDFLAKGEEYQKYEPEIFDPPHPSIIVGDENEKTLFLKDNQLQITEEIQGKQNQERPLKELPLNDQLTFLQSAEQAINLAQKEINIHQLMDQIYTNELDLPHPVTTRLINDQERSLTQIIRIDDILNFKDNEGKTIPDQYVLFTDRENIYDMAFNNTVKQLLDAANNQGLIDTLKEKVDENLRDIGLSAHLYLTGQYEGMSIFIDSYSNSLYIQDKKVARQIEAFSFDDQVNILQQALAQTIERKAYIEAINQKLAERYGQAQTVLQQPDAPLQQPSNQNKIQYLSSPKEAATQTPLPDESLTDMPFQYELLDEKMKAFGINKYDLPWGDSIELVNDKLILHGHNEDRSPRDIAYDDLSNGQKASIYNHVNEAMERMEAMLDTAQKQHLSFSNNMSNKNSEEIQMKPDEQKPQGEQQKTDPEIKNQEKAVTREAAAATILAAIGTDINKMKLADNEHISLSTNKGATIDVQTISVTKNNGISLYGEIDGTKKSISASQLTDDAMTKLAAHLDDLRTNKQTAAVEKPTEQKPDVTQDQKTSQQAAVTPQQNTAEQNADQPKERKVEPIELKPDSKVEYNITKNPVLDRVYDIQLFVDGEKKAGHHLSVEDRKAFFDNKVTGPELVPKYFEKELAGQKLPENIERHHNERKQDAAQDQQAGTKQQQNTDQSKERKVEPIELKPDSKVEYNITKNPALDRVYDIQLFVDGEKKAGHHLSVEDRKAFFDNKVTGPELLPKYFEKELAGQKLPENIERHRNPQKAEDKVAQEQKNSQQAAVIAQQNADAKTNVKPSDVIETWKKASEPEKTTFIQRENANGKFYQTFGDDASKVATILNRQAKNVTEGPNANLPYISVSQKDMPNVMKALKEQNDPIKVVGMDGKYARVLPEAQAKEQVQAADLSKYNVPEGKQVSDVKVWQYQGQAYMNGFVDGNKLNEKIISKEDWAAFKENKATPEQIVGKYYSPAEMEAKQEVKQSMAMSR